MATHQLPAGEFAAGGVITGLMILGESGSDSVGFSIGVVVVGVEGLVVGTVVIGVVTSICLVEIKIVS